MSVVTITHAVPAMTMFTSNATSTTSSVVPAVAATA